MNWLHYLLEANLYLAVFYAGYYLFLRRETYYTLNRFYLLFGSVVSFILPVIQLGMLKPVPHTVNIVHFVYTGVATTPIPAYTAPVAPIFSWQNGIVDVYLFGAVIVLVVLLVKLYQLVKLTRVKKPASDGSYKVVHINGSDTAFSFFNYLFIGTNIEQSEMIIEHELVHIRQKHSADIIFTELLKIINWFNPFVYLLQYSLKEIHEYIADEKIASSGTDTLTYSSFLVNNAYGLSGSSITHSFFNYNLLKKRIIMLHQKRSGSLARLKYLLAIPICGGLLCASTLAFSKTYGWVDIAPHRDTDKTTSPTKLHELQTPVTVHELPPPPPPPVRRVKFPTPNPMTVKTVKGYPYSEGAYMENGKSDITVTIQEKDGSHKEFTKSTATKADIALLKEKYGYVFPAHLHRPPPPPPKPRVVKFPPPVVVPDGKTPPPPPPAPPKHMAHKLQLPVVAPDGKTPPTPRPTPPLVYTKKGYKYQEDGYVADGKTDFRVTVFEKNGNQLSFFKSKASDAEVKLLKDKYGYTFPNMNIYTKMPPPPPTAPENSTSANSVQLNKNEPLDNITLNGITLTRNRPANYRALNPLLIINGIKYYTIGKMDNQTLNFSATDSTIVFKDDKAALEKLGPDAQKGVFYLYGKVELAVLSHGSIAK